MPDDGDYDFEDQELDRAIHTEFLWKDLVKEPCPMPEQTDGDWVRDWVARMDRTEPWRRESVQRAFRIAGRLDKLDKIEKHARNGDARDVLDASLEGLTKCQPDQS